MHKIEKLISEYNSKIVQLEVEINIINKRLSDKRKTLRDTLTSVYLEETSDLSSERSILNAKLMCYIQAKADFGTLL